MQLDNKDMRILYELEADARITSSKIAKRIRLPKETVSYRIQRLIQNKHIKGFHSIINASQLGYSYYRIFLKFHKITSHVEEQIIEFLLDHRNCANIRIMEGPYDMVFVTTHQKTRGLTRFIDELMERFGEVIQQKSIHIINASYKFTKKIAEDGRVIRFDHDAPQRNELDDIDQSILSILSWDSRIKLTELSRRIGQDVSTVRYHIRKMVDKRIIVIYSAAIDYGKLQREHIQLDICLKNRSIKDSLVEFFSEKEISLYAYSLVGKYDLSIEFIVKDDAELREILKQFRETYLKGYISYDVSHIYREHIPNWSPFLP